MKLRYYIARRLLLLIPILFGVTIVAFTLSHVVGDPLAAYVTERTPDTVRQLIIDRYHFDDPIYIQYFYYLDALRVPTGIRITGVVLPRHDRALHECNVHRRTDGNTAGNNIGDAP